MNAREFLGKNKIAIKEEVDARKEKIGPEQAWRILKNSTVVYVGRQKRYSKFIPSEGNRTELLAQVMGRSGNLRAPTLKKGRVLLVGFCEEMYIELL